uniref:Uncharacterized protein n=1 Tax=Anguilla anguilla TaxID=7936 RepID=A0A0E9R5U7_ANGAN
MALLLHTTISINNYRDLACTTEEHRAIHCKM